MKKTILIILMVIFSNSYATKVKRRARYNGEVYFVSPDFSSIFNKKNKIGFIILDNGKVNVDQIFKKYERKFEDNDGFIEYLYTESNKQFEAHGINAEAIKLPPKIRKMGLIDPITFKNIPIF